MLAHKVTIPGMTAAVCRDYCSDKDALFYATQVGFSWGGGLLRRNTLHACRQHVSILCRPCRPRRISCRPGTLVASIHQLWRRFRRARKQPT